VGSGQAHGTVAKGRTTGASLFGRYTEQARRAIFFAHFEAIHRRAEAISLAHLFLGISWDENSRAAVVGSLKDKLLDICAALGVPVRPSTEIPYDRKVVIPLDDTSKIVLAFAVEEADGDGQYWIDTDHLLRGLLRFRNDVSTALEAVQLDLATVRAASKRHQSEFPPNPPPSLMPGGNSFGEGPRMVSRPFLTLAVLALVELLVLVTLAWLK